jgi:hypothetical protein
VVGTIAEKLYANLQEDLERVPPIEFLRDAMGIDGMPIDFPKKLTQLQYRVSVLLNLTNLMEVHKLGEEATEFKGNMVDLFDRAIQRYATITSAFLNRRDTSTMQLYSVVRVMRGLLKNDHLCPKVKLHLASKFSTKVLDFWKQMFWRGLPHKSKSQHFLCRTLLKVVLLFRRGPCQKSQSEFTYKRISFYSSSR